MIYQVQDVVRDVRICLDENMRSEELLREEDAETLALDEIVKSKIEEAAAGVQGNAASHLLEAGHNLGDSVCWGDQESGWILLPDDFLRLTRFRMSDWERAVHEAISAADPRYGLQRQRVKALRGTAQKPVCAIVDRPEGKALEFYSCKSEEAYVAEGRYVAYPRIDEYGGIDISERCYRAVVYMTAGLVLLSYGETEKAEAMIELSKGMIQ